MKFIRTLLVLVIAISTIQAQKYLAIDNHATSIQYTENYVSAAEQLVAPYGDDVSKARAIFTWIASHIEYDQKRFERIVDSGRREKVEFSASSPEEMEQKRHEMVETFIQSTLKDKKGICQDYAYLFKAMCESVGLEAEFVVGFGRFSPSNIGIVHKKGNHAWNAVKLNGKWELVDVTWSTGMGMDENFGDGFFMVDPEVFIMSHYPDDNKWQLMESVIDPETFSMLPFMHSYYLKYNVAATQPVGGKVSKNDVFKIQIQLQDDQRLVILKSGKVARYEFASEEDNWYALDLSKTRLLGLMSVGIVAGQRIEPLLTFKVSNR